MEEKIIVLSKAPLDEYTPDDVRNFLLQDTSEKHLAQIIAKVSNQVGWMSHEVDDLDNDWKTNEKTEMEYNDWCALYKELLNLVVKILEEENIAKKTNHILKDIGYHYMIEPFMERNGYTDGAGWWVEK